MKHVEDGRRLYHSTLCRCCQHGGSGVQSAVVTSETSHTHGSNKFTDESELLLSQLRDDIPLDIASVTSSETATIDALKGLYTAQYSPQRHTTERFWEEILLLSSIVGSIYRRRWSRHHLLLHCSARNLKLLCSIWLTRERIRRSENLCITLSIVITRSSNYLKILWFSFYFHYVFITRPRSFINATRDIDMTVPSVCLSVCGTLLLHQND